MIHVLGPSLGRDAALPVAHGAVGIHLGVMLDEKLHHLRLALRRSPHERSLAAPLLARVHLGAVTQEQLGSFEVAYRATTMSAVWPSGFGESTFAPARKRDRSTRGSAVTAASCIGEEP